MMKRTLPVLAALALTLSLFSCASEDGRASKTELTTFEEKASYAVGQDFAERLIMTGSEMDVDALLQGLGDRLEGREALLPEKEMGEVMSEFLNQRRERHEVEQKAQSGDDIKKAQTFLAENKTRDGVTTTESGLQYMVLEEGDGPRPKTTDEVKVNYRGTLLDGTEFDSSEKQGRPIEFRVNGVIAGWTEGLQLMRVGSKYKFFIPSDLAYGERSAGPYITPHSTLIFEVELLEIK